MTEKSNYSCAMRALMHFLVDGICVCCLYLVAEWFSMERMIWTFMTYNVMAFLTQPLTGHLVDRRADSSRLTLFTAVGLLCVGAITVAVTTALAGMAEWVGGLVFLAAVILGAGNSLFHVWGGKATALETGNDIRQLGMFVATGAMGLAVGLVFASWPLLMAFIIGLALLTVSGTTEVTEASGTTEHTGSTGKAVALSLSPVWAVGVMLLIILVVMMRSLLGQTFVSGGLKSMTLVVGLTAMLGKMAGGWLSHCMGLIPSIAVMVVVVAVALAWPGDRIAVMLIGLFAVNCTMPVTLYLANIVMPGHEGLAFGLLAAALMPGYLLATMNYAL